MRERFEEVFEAVAEEFEMEWWELFDSDSFGEVERRLQAEFGEDVIDSEEFEAWVDEMAWEL